MAHDGLATRGKAAIVGAVDLASPTGKLGRSVRALSLIHI